jgi:hypothetical protein
MYATSCHASRCAGVHALDVAQYNKLKFATTRKKSHYKTVLMQTETAFMQTESAFMQTESAIMLTATAIVHTCSAASLFSTVLSVANVYFTIANSATRIICDFTPVYASPREPGRSRDLPGSLGEA